MNPFTRGKTGSRASNAVVNEELVRQIRRLAATHSVRELSGAYGVAAETIRKILRRETWAWVVDEAAEVGPLTDADREAAAASAARVMAQLGQDTDAPTGLAKLQQLAQAEARKREGVEGMIEELGTPAERARAFLGDKDE